MATTLPPICARPSRGLFLLALGAVAALVAPSNAVAGGTQTVRVADFDEFDDGEVEGAAIEASGRVTVGFLPTATELKAGTAFTCVSAGKSVLVGTSDPASVVTLDSPRKGGALAAKTLAELPGVVVSAMTTLPGGDVLAATLPGGTIHRIDARGKVSTFATLKVEQIWALKPHGDRILVATGPKGELFSLSRSGGDAKVILDVDEKDLLSLATVGNDVVVGTAPRAKLYLVTKELEGALLHDFDGDEVRALAVTSDGLLAAVNKFEDRKLSSLDALTKQINRTSLVGQPPSGTLTESSGPTAAARVYHVNLSSKLEVDRAGESAWELWLKKEKQYFTSLLPVDGGKAVLVGSSKDGKIYRLRGVRDVSTVADLDERQATGLCALDRGNVVATTGGTAAAYRLEAAKATKARYVSKVFDADNPSAFGALTLRGVGPFVVRARVGPTDEPDDRWSPWKRIDVRSGPGGLRGTLAALPHRRYAQIEVQLAGPAASLRELTMFYAPENVGPLMKSIEFGKPEFDMDDDDEPSPKINVKWKADARDEDDLIYEVRVRPEGSGDNSWIRLDDADKLLTKKELKWDLSTVPDGVYEIAVTASDEPKNGSARALRDTLVSDPVVVDRARPTITALKTSGLSISAIASDGLTYVHDVSYSVDGGPFRAASPRDGLFDQDKEVFEIQLASDLAPGPHRVVLRARDAFGNLATTAVVINAK